MRTVKILLLVFLIPLVLIAGEQAPKLRLPNDAKPTEYAVQLTIDPQKNDFSGIVTIDLEIAKQISTLWLNATEIQIQKVELTEKSKTQTGSVLPIKDEEFVGLSFTQPIGPGTAKLTITYTGVISDKDNDGIFKMKDGDSWYVYTQFEADTARRAFPCFDEPAYKVPWLIELHVPKDAIALTNSPQESEKVEGATKVVRFVKSHPLPSYLVAFAVGSFEFVGDSKIGKNGTPSRIVTPKGRTAEAKWAVESTTPIFNLLEEYFGIPYPYEKLDQIAIPKVGFAMEHPGLVTYGEEIMLTKPGNETLDFKHGWASVCAHELAHQWFGDLVTMTWWDDTWLNESFASWMGTKIVMRFKPEWDEHIVEIADRARVMKEDSLASARKIREPIRSKDDIENAFDSITYGKGEAILQMFESWVGEEKFRNGVQQYLKKYEWSNATADDFLNSISQASNADVVSAFSTFLNQSGVPLISTQVQCGASSNVNFEMSRSTPLGSVAPSNQLWQVPVCVKYEIADHENGNCYLLKSKDEKTVLDKNGCPQWFFANRDGWGYYHVKYSEDQLNALTKDGGKELSVAERVTLINDFSALMHMGKMPASEALKNLSALLQDHNRHIIVTAIEVLKDLDQPLVTEEIRPKYAAFIQNHFGPLARELGWRPRPGEDDNTKLLRKDLMPFMAQQGDDRELGKEAYNLATQWVKDRKAVDPEMVPGVLCAAAVHGDEALLTLYEQEAKRTQDPEERSEIFMAMSCFENPDVARKVFDIAVSKDFDIRDSMNSAWEMQMHPRTGYLVYDFVTKNFDAIAKRLPRGYDAELPRVGQVYCDEDHAKQVEAFFKPHAEKISGAPRLLDQTLERIHLCAAFRKAQQPSFVQFLQSY
jgi:alanyl aminopeptidase